jgi:drug/metabolite transporter (DMT)-like permease
MHSSSRASKATLALIGITAGWGLTFPLIKTSTESLPPFSFIFLRFLIAGLSLLTGAIVGGHSVLAARGKRKGEWLAGTILGTLLLLGFGFQTVGMQSTSASNAGFITGLSVVLVPILSLGSGQKVGVHSWIGILLSLLGISLLSLTETLSFSRGDLLVLVSAAAFALHILLVGRYSPRSDPLRLTLIQVFSGAGLSAVPAFLLERAAIPSGGLPYGVWASLLFCGVFATALAFWVQVTFQRDSTPVKTALIFSCEPVFAAVFSSYLSDEQLSARQLAGGALMVIAMLIAELGPQLWKPIRIRLSN